MKIETVRASTPVSEALDDAGAAVVIGFTSAVRDESLKHVAYMVREEFGYQCIILRIVHEPKQDGKSG